MAWQTPKTNWGAADVPLPDDINRIEGNVQELQNTKETPAGAQGKANTAETNAKNHANGLVGTLGNLLTVAKNNAVAAINELVNDIMSHKADIVKHITATERSKWDNYLISGYAASVDWNTLTEPGANILNKGDAANGPGTSCHFHCFVVGYMAGQGYLAQIAIPYGDGPSVLAGMFIRGCYNGTWTPWYKMWHSGNDGAGSGLDADTIRGQDISAAVENYVQDNYQLHSELYYQGYHSGPNIAGLRGMTFDNFLNTVGVDIAKTTAQVDTSNKTVINKQSNVYIPPSSLSGGGSAAYQFKPADLPKMCDGSLSTYARASSTLDEWRGSTIDASLGGITRSIMGFRAYGRAQDVGSTGDCWIRRILYSSKDNPATSSDWTEIYNGSTLMFPKGSNGWVTHEFTALSAKHVRFMPEIYVSTGTGYFYIYEVEIKVPSYILNVFQSAVRTLEENPNKLILYTTVKPAPGGSIVPQLSSDGGATWETPILVNSRPDPLFSGYTENQYVLIPQTIGNRIVLKATLTPSSDGITPSELKRYGLYWL